jgi:hypothetical protein
MARRGYYVHRTPQSSGHIVQAQERRQQRFGGIVLAHEWAASLAAHSGRRPSPHPHDGRRKWPPDTSLSREADEKPAPEVAKKHGVNAQNTASEH